MSEKIIKKQTIRIEEKENKEIKKFPHMVDKFYKNHEE